MCLIKNLYEEFLLNFIRDYYNINLYIVLSMYNYIVFFLLLYFFINKLFKIKTITIKF